MGMRIVGRNAVHPTQRYTARAAKERPHASCPPVAFFFAASETSVATAAEVASTARSWRKPSGSSNVGSPVQGGMHEEAAGHGLLTTRPRPAAGDRRRRVVLRERSVLCDGAHVAPDRAADLRPTANGLSSRGWRSSVSGGSGYISAAPRLLSRLRLGYSLGVLSAGLGQWQQRPPLRLVGGEGLLDQVANLEDACSQGGRVATSRRPDPASSSLSRRPKRAQQRVAITGTVAQPSAPARTRQRDLAWTRHGEEGRTSSRRKERRRWRVAAWRRKR